MTAAELGGPVQKPLGNSDLGSLLCNKLLLWLKSWPLKSLRFALDLVLNTDFHLCRNEPHLRREQDGRLPLLPGGHCQPGSNLAEGGSKEKRLSVCLSVCQCQVPQPPAPTCLPHPGEPAHKFWTENSHTMFTVPCLLLCTWGQAVLNPATLTSAMPCPGGGNEKVQKTFMRGKASDYSSALIYLSVRYFGKSGVLFCICVDLGGEFSAAFLFEM